MSAYQVIQLKMKLKKCKNNQNVKDIIIMMSIMNHKYYKYIEKI